MNLREEIFKNRFKDKASLQGIDKDDLWSNISAGLDADVVVDKKSRYNLALLVLLFLFFGGLFFFILGGLKKGQDINVEPPIEVAASAVDSKSLKTEKAHLANDEKSRVVVADSEIENDFDKTTNSENKSADKNIALENSVAGNVTEKRKEVSTIDENTTFVTKDNKVQRSPESVTNSRINSNIANAKNDASKSSSSAKESLLSIMKTKEKTRIEKPSELSSKNQLIETPVSESKSKSTIASLSLMTMPSPELDFDENSGSLLRPFINKKSPFEVGAQIGLNSLTTNYKKGNDNANLVNDLSQSISSDLGYSAAVHITYLFEEKYSLSTGVQYDYFQTTFDRTSESPTTILDDNLHLRNAVKTRVVLHHNQFKAISVPLEIGTRKRFVNFDVGINLGLSYNFFISQKGKLIDNEQAFVEFDSASSSVLPYRKSFIAYQFSIYIDTKVCGRFKIRLSPVFKYIPLAASDLHGVDQNVMKIGLNGGVVYRF